MKLAKLTATILTISIWGCNVLVADPIITLFNTGVAVNDPVNGTPIILLPDGTSETHYVLSSTGTAFVTTQNGFPIGSPFWIGDDSNSKWISPQANENSLSGGAPSDAPGQYIYRTTFDLTGFDPSTAVINGSWSTDDQGLDILINGISTGSTALGFKQFAPFAISTNFVPGTNTLDFVVLNGPKPDGDPNPSGLRVTMTGTVIGNCQLSNYTGFYQGDGPPFFGFVATNGRASTVSNGCALCSLASMLTSFPGLSGMTPARLDAALTNLPNHFGYSGRANVNFNAIGLAIQYPVYKIDQTANVSNASIDTYLKTQICTNGNRVILRLHETIGGIDENREHFVLVTGRTNNDWNVFDPGWKQATQLGALSTLSGHTNGFNPIIGGTPKALRKFNVAGAITYALLPDQVPVFNGTLACPAEMLITDPFGQRLGYDPATGSDVFEIPGGTYGRDFPIEDDAADDDVVEGDPTGVKSFSVPFPLPATYQIVTTGTGAGPFALALQANWPGSSAQSASYSGIASVGTAFTNNFLVIVPPLITDITASGNGVVFSFFAQTNVSYSVESTTSLINPSWTPVQTIAGIDDVVTFNGTNSAGILFYHVKAQ